MTDELTNSTAEESYTKYLQARDSDQSFLSRQYVRYYRWHIRRRATGRVLDIGCGIGMNMRFLDSGCVGVDHNPTSIKAAKEFGFTAFTNEEFKTAGKSYLGAFDSMLIAHVMEHLDFETGVELVQEYLPYLKPNGRVVLITPNDRELKLDETHVRYVDLAVSRRTLEAVGGLKVIKAFGRPLPPKLAAGWHPVNENVAIAERVTT